MFPELKPLAFQIAIPQGKNRSRWFYPWIPHWELLAATGVLHSVCSRSAVPIPWGLLLSALPQSKVPQELVAVATMPFRGQDSVTSLDDC